MEQEAEGRSWSVETNHLMAGGEMEFGLSVRISFTPSVYCPNALGYRSAILAIVFPITLARSIH